MTDESFDSLLSCGDPYSRRQTNLSGGLTNAVESLCVKRPAFHDDRWVYPDLK